MVAELGGSDDSVVRLLSYMVELQRWHYDDGFLWMATAGTGEDGEKELEELSKDMDSLDGVQG